MERNTEKEHRKGTQKRNTEREHMKRNTEKKHRKGTQKRKTEKNTQEWTFSPFPSQFEVNIFKFVYNESVLSAYIKPNVILM